MSLVRHSYSLQTNKPRQNICFQRSICLLALFSVPANVQGHLMGGLQTNHSYGGRFPGHGAFFAESKG